MRDANGYGQQIPGGDLNMLYAGGEAHDSGDHKEGFDVLAVDVLRRPRDPRSKTFSVIPIRWPVLVPSSRIRMRIRASGSLHRCPDRLTQPPRPEPLDSALPDGVRELIDECPPALSGAASSRMEQTVAGFERGFEHRPSHGRRHGHEPAGLGQALAGFPRAVGPANARLARIFRLGCGGDRGRSVPVFEG